MNKKELSDYLERQSCKTSLTPIKLHAHMRAITSTKFSKDGKFVFTTAKDRTPTVWDANTGERMGTYNGHKGAIWCSDPNHDSTLLATASADQSINIWNINNGELLQEIEQEAAVKDVYFSKDNYLIAVTDNMFGETPAVHIYQISSDGKEYTLILKVESKVKINRAILNKDNTMGYFCCEDGSVNSINISDGTTYKSIIHPNHNCKCIKLDPNGLTILTGSNDNTSKLLNIKDLSVINTYVNSFPINTVVSVNDNIKEHIIIGGGVEAASVTTTDNGRFDITFYSKPLEEKLGSFSCHFGPVTSLDMTFDGSKLVSGGEDGFVYIYKLGKEYFNS